MKHLVTIAFALLLAGCSTPKPNHVGTVQPVPSAITLPALKASIPAARRPPSGYTVTNASGCTQTIYTNSTPWQTNAVVCKPTGTVTLSWWPPCTADLQSRTTLTAPWTNIAAIFIGSSTLELPATGQSAFYRLRTYILSVELAWDLSADKNVTGYKIYYDTKSGPPYAHVVTVGLTNQVLVPAFAMGQTAYFAATAYNQAGLESPYTAEVAYRLPPERLNLR